MGLRLVWCAAAVSLAMADTALAQNPDQAAWAGRYRYQWEGGRTAGGSGIVVTYTLRIGRGPADCALDITGYQSDEHILCEVGADADNLWVRFRSYAGGELVNRYGTALYRPGQELFRLRRGGGNGALVTEWQSMGPGEGRNQPAVRFRRV